MLGTLFIVVEVLANLRGRDTSEGIAVGFLGLFNPQDDGIAFCLNVIKSVQFDVV
jgi:hypothetical protein